MPPPKPTTPSPPPSTSDDQGEASPIWGGRFAAGPAALMDAINTSVDVDRRLWAEDIAGSRAHCTMLIQRGIIAQQDGDAILSGLDRIEEELAHGRFTFSRVLEDIHMNVEGRLHSIIGDAAGRLHTARSRNDQVATDFKLWVRSALDRVGHACQMLQRVLIDQAEHNISTVMPGFTHLQSAQPVTLGHHLLAYVEMLGRDRGRLADARRRLNECPLGAGALAGTAFPIDRTMTASALGFDRPAANSLDAVSDRDFALEFLAAGAILAIHLSRLAEEIVLWSSERFGFVRLADSFTTGSSIMPQKRNPDAAELVRAKAGRVIAALTGLLIVMKALPLAYAKDMQEDKEPVFDAADTLELSLAALAAMIESAKFDLARLEAATVEGFPTATDLADWLVRTLGLPFRRAHHITGAIVRAAEERGCALADLPLDAMQAVEPAITAEVYSVLSVDASVHSRHSEGGTAPDRVREAIVAARRRFLLD